MRENVERVDPSVRGEGEERSLVRSGRRRGRVVVSMLRMERRDQGRGQE